MGLTVFNLIRSLANILWFIGAILTGFGASAQQNSANISTTTTKTTLEDIWKKHLFARRYVQDLNWQSDGQHYSLAVPADSGAGTNIIEYHIGTGQQSGILATAKDLTDAQGRPLEPESYVLSPSQTQILLATASEPIYRRSSKAYYYLFDIKTKKLRPLSDNGLQSYPTFSPDGKKIAFVRANNLFVTDLQTYKEEPLTSDGLSGSIINGSTDWVYEEEFEFAQAFFWAPDSKKIAFYRFDESKVKTYNMQIWDSLYPTDYRYKYPKAGQDNAQVRILIHNLETNKTINTDIDGSKDEYIPRIRWTQNPNLLAILRLNRLQNNLELLHANAQNGNCTTILTEKSATYVEINDNLSYLKNGRQFVWTSEADGYRHVYLYDMQGKNKRQVTKGKWETDRIIGLDFEEKNLFYTSCEQGPQYRHFYKIGLNGKNKQLLTASNGNHAISAGPGVRYFTDDFSTALSAPIATLYSQAGKPIRVLEDNADLKANLTKAAWQPLEFFSFKTSESINLKGWMIRPPNMQQGRKYPVIMYVYGGPGHQTVLDTWDGYDMAWFEMMAGKGYVVVSVDGRGTGGRGAEFKKCTYKNLGALELKDQIETAKYLGSLPFIDPNRIGIWGWSYGGYMSSLCLTKGAEFFKLGVAVAPVTNWRFYDTIYTERYLQTPQLNPDGYDQNSPTNFAGLLKGKFLLIHGTSDDNVHVQNSIALQNALIKANKNFEMFYYPNRNHGIYGGNTRLHLFNQITNFIVNNL